MGSALERWGEELASWAIPDEILAAAPEPPWAFPVEVFARAAAHALRPDTPRGPSTARAAEALAGGGTVLDVGVGGGAASLPLVPPAIHVTGVDQSPELLAAFADAAGRLGVDHAVVHGRWPDVADEVPPADVVVCHHVLYNVADLAPFVAALASRARRRVVVELTAEHPMKRFNGLWRAIHGIDRPTGPVAGDAVAAVAELGIAVRWEASERQLHPTPDDERLAFARRRLCVGPERDDELRRLLAEQRDDALRSVVTLWWDA